MLENLFGGDLYSNDGVITVALAVGHLGSTMVACVLVVDGSAAAIYVHNNYATMCVYSLSVGNNWSTCILKSSISFWIPVFGRVILLHLCV